MYGKSNNCIYGEKGIRNGGKLGGPFVIIFENRSNKILEK